MMFTQTFTFQLSYHISLFITNRDRETLETFLDSCNSLDTAGLLLVSLKMAFTVGSVVNIMENKLCKRGKKRNAVI